MGVCLSSGSPGTACSAGTSSALSIATFSVALTAQMLKVTTCSVSSVTSALAITSLLLAIHKLKVLLVLSASLLAVFLCNQSQRGKGVDSKVRLIC